VQQFVPLIVSRQRKLFPGNYLYLIDNKNVGKNCF
jgi:hypothetical protein